MLACQYTIREKRGGKKGCTDREVHMDEKKTHEGKRERMRETNLPQRECK
jgi:hypothetical protein